MVDDVSISVADIARSKKPQTGRQWMRVVRTPERKRPS
jgi:hypothetical protein